MELIPLALVVALFVALNLVLASIPARIAQAKGRRREPWLVYGFFLLIPALIHAHRLEPHTPVDAPPPSPDPRPGSETSDGAPSENDPGAAPAR
ncbi:MAG: hypothetical protein IT371_21630 [Deltaproteobacteria bacterium]|nr:hypothetical protein [Deltaproteobacteria bacterium]